MSNVEFFGVEVWLCRINCGMMLRKKMIREASSQKISFFRTKWIRPSFSILGRFLYSVPGLILSSPCVSCSVFFTILYPCASSLRHSKM